MKVQKGWSCFVFFVLHMTHVAWTQQFAIIGPSTDIFALLGEDVTLPASLSPPLSAQEFEVRWFRNDLNSPVLLYQNLQIRSESQLQAYKGRTSLSPEELVSGNVSLRLLNVRASDSGLYRCFVGSRLWEEEARITLNIEVLGSPPVISINTAEDQQSRLECSSEKWSSRPEVTWRDMNGIDMTSQSTLTVQRDDESLLTVSSVIPIKWEFNVFSCLMRSNTTRPAYQSKLGIYVFSPNVPGWSVVFWLLMALCVIAALLLILKWQRMRDKKNTYKTKAVDILPIWNLRKEIDMAQHPALTLKFSKVINGFPHEDLLKITEYYKPQLTYVMNFDISSVLQLLVTKRIFTNDEAKAVKVKAESERIPGVESFIGEMMNKEKAVLVSLWEALAEESVRYPSPNVKGILDEVTEWGPDLLKEIQASTQLPPLEPHIKDLHETHRLTMSESTRSLDDQRPSEDPLTSAVGLETQYTELMVIKQDIKNELPKAGKTQERLEEEGATKNYERIWTEQLFKRRPKSKTPPKIIVVSGVAGIGKTTMVQKIMFDWARGIQHQNFAFVFLFKFRALNLLYNETQISLTTLIEKHYKYLTNDKLIEILQKPESLLFILDGLEEYKYKVNLTDSQLCSDPDNDVPVHILVTSLVNQILLKGCTVLITTRPTALESLDMERVDRFAEILGFFNEQRLMYFKKFFGDADQGSEAFQYVEENAILYTMCFNPSYCWIICSVLKSHFMTPEEERGAAPRTVTEMFVVFLHNILTNHRQVAKDQRGILVRLGKMAYYGVKNRTYVFNEKQEMSTFGLQQVMFSSFLSGFLFKQSTLEHTTFTFHQFTLQEFMAAYSFYLDPLESVEELLKKRDLCKDGRFEIVTHFMAGLAWCTALKTLEGILGEFKGKTTQLIQEWVRQKAKQVLRGRDQNEALRVCHWLSETQNVELIRDAIGKDLEMNFSGTTLSPLDYAVLASVISCCGELKKIDLSETPRTSECIRRLAPGLSCCSEVCLVSCHLTSTSCSALSSALSAPKSQLTELRLNENNNMEDLGVEQLCEGLRSPNCKLEKLELRSCGLTSGCCSALSSALSAPNTHLTELWLDYNNIEDSGVEQLCEGLRCPNCRLETLWLSECGLTSACCSALSSVFSSPNSQLTYLDLYNNNLGDSGARQLSEGLRNDKCKIKDLGLSNNRISDSEKRNLSSLQGKLRRSGRQLTIYTWEFRL